MTVSIGFTMEDQEQDEWCWAANAVSAAEYLGSTAWTQCRLVNGQFTQSTCCVDGTSIVCNKPWYLERALTAVNCNYTYVNAPIALTDVVTNLTAKTAIEVRIGWTDGAGRFDGSGHFVAVTAADPATTTLHIQDPWYHASDVQYDDFMNRYKTVGVWTGTYLIDRLLGGSAGGSRALPTAESIALFQNAYQAVRMTMKDRTDTPIYTLALDMAATDGPLEKMRKTGMQRFSNHGVLEQAEASETFSILADEMGISQARTTQHAMSDLRNTRLLQIPGLLVTAVLGEKGGKTAVKPIGRIPSFLEDRLYTKPEFEALIQKQAQHKIALIQNLREEEKA